MIDREQNIGKDKINPEEKPFDYLWNLFDKEEKIWQEDFMFHLTKDPNAIADGSTTSERVIVFQIDYLDGKPREQYLLDQEGVVEMEFESPPLTGVPPAPTHFPADLNPEERRRWDFNKAVAVAKFIQEHLPADDRK